MPKRIRDTPIKELSGTLLTAKITPATTAASRRAINFQAGFTELLLEPEDQAMRVGFTTKIMAVYHFDASAAVGSQFIDLLGDDKALTNDAVTGTAKATFATSDYLYIGTLDRHDGYRFDLTTPFNTAVASIWAGDALEYSTGNGWVSTAVTDDTEATANIAFGRDGTMEITTLPAEGVWRAAHLRDIVNSSAPQHGHIPLYWTRMTPEVTHNAATTFNNIIPLLKVIADGAAAADAANFKKNVEYTIEVDTSKYGGLEAWSIETGDSDLRMTWIKR